MSACLRPCRGGGDDGFWHRVGRQFADPRGGGGRLLGRLMVWLNRIPNRLAVAALAPQAGEAILEIGFGPGDALGAILRAAPLCRLAGIDRSAAMVELARRRNRRALAAGRLDLRAGSMLALPWPDGSFDKLLAVNVAYFFDTDGLAAGEIRRVLRPGGRLVLYVTDRETMVRWRFAGPQSHRIYGEADLRAVLAGAGFSPATVAIEPVRLPLGMRGWMATAEA